MSGLNKRAKAAKAYGTIMEELKAADGDPEAAWVIEQYVAELRHLNWKVRQRMHAAELGKAQAEATIAAVARTNKGKELILNAVLVLPLVRKASEPEPSRQVQYEDGEWSRDLQ